jgi:ubiquinone/menaquinone biosynthesis C-methylase UbiE
LGWAEHWARPGERHRRGRGARRDSQAQAPKADPRVGPIERLPWRDESFDLVTGFNAFQFAAHFVAALTEAGRVPWRGGRVAICNWGRIEDREVHAIFAPILHIGPEVAERVFRTTVEADAERSGDPSARTGSRTGSGI